MKKCKKKDKSQKEINIQNEIEFVKKELQKLKINPDFKENLDLSENLKNLNKQLSKVRIEIIKKDKSKNIVKDKKNRKFINKRANFKRFSSKRT